MIFSMSNSTNDQPNLEAHESPSGLTPPSPPEASKKASQKRSFNPVIAILILSGVFFAIFLLVSGGIFFGTLAPNHPEHPSATALFKNEAVAVIELNGVILDSKKMLRRLERAEEDPAIKAVVLRLNSPGGAVAPSQEIYEKVKAFKKPLIASMGSIAASGAFYIACGAKEVFANPGTITGSIGVIMEFANLEKLYEWAKIKRYSIKTGRFKDAGAEYREMTPEDQALLQGMVDDVLVQFKQAVSTGRKLSMEQVDQIADGRVLSGNQAKAAKLVDQLGTIDDAIQEAAKVAGIHGKPHVVYPEEPKRRLLDFILENASDSDSDSEADSKASSLGVFYWVDRALRGVSGNIPQNNVIGPGIYWIWRGVS